MKDYYAILDVPPDASQEKIKEQWHLSLLAWHPDRFPTPAQKAKAEEKTKDLNGAYEILGNPTKRAQYDRERGSSWFNEEERNKEKARAEADQRRAEQERQQKQQAAEKQRHAEYERQQRERAEEQRRRNAQEQRQREFARSVSQSAPSTQVPVEKTTPARKLDGRGLIRGILASFVLSSIWFGLVLVLFGEAGGLLVETPSVTNSWIGAALILGGPVLILLGGIWPVYAAVGGWTGIVGGLVAVFIGGTVGMMAGAFIQLIFILFRFS